MKFLSLNNELSKNGVLSKEKNIFNFNFKKVKFQYESYRGDLVCLKYFIRVNIVKTMRTFSYDEEFAVIKPYDAEILKKNDEPISMHVGIKDLLNILIELNHINYSIHGTLKGGVTFGKVKLLITKMELQLIKKETIYNNTNSDKNSKTKVVASYELIDGGPYKNETIPFRLFLSAYNLTPTYKDISGYFSTRYYLNLVFKDQEDNRYFKQKEIFLFRLFLENNNKINKNNIEYLKDFITEPIDYGDYFSSFNIDDDIDDDKKNKNDLIKTKTKEPEPSDFFFKSNLKGFISDEDINDDNFINIKNRSNSVFDIKINKDILGINDEDEDEGDNIHKNQNYKNYKDDNYISKERKKNNSVPNNRVINIKEKDKYKNNDILINDNNYYNAYNYNTDENDYDNELDKKPEENISKKIKDDNDKFYSDSLITSYFHSNYGMIGNKK